MENATEVIRTTPRKYMEFESRSTENCTQARRVHALVRMTGFATRFWPLRLAFDAIEVLIDAEPLDWRPIVLSDHEGHGGRGSNGRTIGVCTRGRSGAAG